MGYTWQTKCCFSLWKHFTIPLNIEMSDIKKKQYPRGCDCCIPMTLFPAHHSNVCYSKIIGESRITQDISHLFLKFESGATFLLPCAKIGKLQEIF